MKLINMGLERKLKKKELKKKRIETEIKQLELDQKKIEFAKMRKEKIEKFQKDSEKLSMKEIAKIPIDIINSELIKVFVKLKEKGSEINKTNKFETKDINKENT